MKKPGVLLLIITMIISLFYQTAYAAEITTSELDLTTYLNELSATRDIKVSKEDIELSLAIDSKKIDDFMTMDELKSYLGEVIRADLSNMNILYNKYNLDQNTLSQVLNEYGEELKDYIFLKDLDTALALYTNKSNTEREADFETKLTSYLSDVSTIRGYTITKDDINAYLSKYYSTIDDFVTVIELRDYLGDVIKADLSNLDYFNTNYNMDENTMLELIKENNKDINDFIYIGELEELLWTSTGNSKPEFDISMYKDVLQQIQLTDTELKNLENHFKPIIEYISSTEGQPQMMDLSSRMMTLGNTLMEKATVDANYKPSDAEISEFASMYKELLSVLKLNVVFSFTKDGVETIYSIEDLMKMEDVKDVDYKVTFYNDKSELLADAVITSDFIKSNLGTVIEEVTNATGIEVNNNSIRTVKGGKLPKTAANYIPKVLLGIIITIFGISIFYIIRIDEGEIFEK